MLFYILNNEVTNKFERRLWRIK